MDHSNKNSSGSESNASVICKGYSFSNLAEPVQIHRETYTRTATIQTPVTGDTNGMTRQSVRKPHMNDHHLHRRCFKIDRVGGGITPAVLSHHRTCGSAYGGSLSYVQSFPPHGRDADVSGRNGHLRHHEDYGAFDPDDAEQVHQGEPAGGGG